MRAVREVAEAVDDGLSAERSARIRRDAVRVSELAASGFEGPACRWPVSIPRSRPCNGESSGRDRSQRVTVLGRCQLAAVDRFRVFAPMPDPRESHTACGMMSRWISNRTGMS